MHLGHVMSRICHSILNPFFLWIFVFHFYFSVRLFLPSISLQFPHKFSLIWKSCFSHFPVFNPTTLFCVSWYTAWLFANTLHDFCAYSCCFSFRSWESLSARKPLFFIFCMIQTSSGWWCICCAISKLEGRRSLLLFHEVPILCWGRERTSLYA